MADRRPSITAAFLAMLALGGIAVAIVAIAVGLSASAAQQINEAGRDAAAVDLLEQRHAVAALLAAEQAAVFMDQISGDNALVAAPFTAQRKAALDNATIIIRKIADRGDSAGNEARRWLAALDTAAQPESVADDFERLVAYDELGNVARIAGVADSDEHRSETLRSLETVALTPSSLWLYVYVAAELENRTALPPPAVDRFLEYLGTPSGLSPDAGPPSRTLAEGDMATLASLGVSQETINTVLAGDAIATIDEIARVGNGQSTGTVTTHEAFVAADAAYHSLDELAHSAMETTRIGLSSEIETAEQIRLVTTIVTPLLLLVLIGIGIVIHRSARNREKALERERHLLNSRNRFMRMVSHELRTPATAISGFSQMLSTQWTSLTETEISEFLSIVDSQSTHLSLIVDDLLTLSHLETGRLRLHLTTVNLAGAAGDAIAMVDGRYGIEVATSIDPELNLLADSDRLVQILRNLVENAAKYGKTGVAVNAAAIGNQCEIIISDTGPGLPPETAERIFRFWDRVDREEDRFRGHGMGLAIAKHLAGAMVGDLRYRPHEPTGSEFVLTLPMANTRRPTTADDGAPLQATTVS